MLPPALAGVCAWLLSIGSNRGVQGNASRRLPHVPSKKLIASGSCSAAPLMQIWMHAWGALHGHHKDTADVPHGKHTQVLLCP